MPSAFGTMLAALEEQLDPPDSLILRGARDRFAPWREMLDPAYLPATTVLFVPSEASDLPPPLAKPATEAVDAWLCEGAVCHAPILDPVQLREALGLAKMTVSESAPPPHRSLS
jgi:uncharacterized protein YyaL (SSP411 family)